MRLLRGLKANASLQNPSSSHLSKTLPPIFRTKPLNPSSQEAGSSLSLTQQLHLYLPLQSISPNPFLSLLSSCTDTLTLSKIHGFILVHGLNNHLPCQTKLFSCYASLADLESARKVFDRIPDPDLYSWKVLFRGFILNEQYREAIWYYSQMRCRFCGHDNIIFSRVLKACIELLDLDEGKKLHGHIIKVGDPDCFVLNNLIDMYAKCGDMDSSRRLFDGTQDRNAISWATVISGYAHNDCGAEALRFFNHMQRSNNELDEYTVVSLLTSCSVIGALHQGKWVHGCAIKLGMCTNPFVGSALVDMYAKRGDITDARYVFDEFKNMDAISWTAMIVGYTQRNYPQDALKLFSDKKWMVLVPNSVTISSILSAAAQLRDMKLGSSIHSLGLKLGVEKCLVVMNALIDMYAKCCMLFEANSIFKGVHCKDIVTWNAMVAGHSQNHQGVEALSLFNTMRSEGCSPDAVTVVCAISSCISLGDFLLGSCFHAYSIMFGFLTNIHVGTALLNFYNKYGDVKLANRIFHEMIERNTVTWCAMLGGYGMQGDYAGSVDIFKKMLKEDLQPNDATFTTILSLCSHTGMVDAGREYFNSMSEHYKIAPSMKHYACMVDMLARAGRLEEAQEFIDRMPIQADTNVWGALLHGCRMHWRFELGEVVVRRMMTLLPNRPDYYVLMSNLYASEGRWDEALKVRKLMEEMGLVKQPGCSSFGIENQFNTTVMKGSHV
ncbi:pentatricopeptide repeat-containing protein At2g03380, mitochondrial-like [Zingiber officinale]|uniref:Uncharacterized protein n=1 Tax=Zingiber officinale TaxID=94328 RepID=A0A8J5LRJ9_ZINOF|nr:pentatricopeptide repeat-containing protein At2g03380, mitochondrial-like [Zingiber officinale]KAG6531434.1 hypothetical protein ZIOFF_005241 [Zingiber officinale]